MGVVRQEEPAVDVDAFQVPSCVIQPLLPNTIVNLQLFFEFFVVFLFVCLVVCLLFPEPSGSVQISRGQKITSARLQAVNSVAMVSKNRTMSEPYVG